MSLEIIDLEKYKDGIVDGLIHGIKDNTKSSHYYYKLGYDFGITLYSRQIDEEEDNVKSS